MYKKIDSYVGMKMIMQGNLVDIIGFTLDSKLIIQSEVILPTLTSIKIDRKNSVLADNLYEDNLIHYEVSI